MARFIEGYRGSGKTKLAVSLIQSHLRAGRKVATNLDLNLDKLVPELPNASYTRIPDFPRSVDLYGLGNAYPELDSEDASTYDENKFGIVVVDEMLTSFNSRNWNEPDRPEVVNWSVQSRKFGWHPCYLGQDIDAVDKQIRETIISELWSCRSSDNLFPGLFFKVFIKPWFSKLVNRFHLVSKYDGKKKDKAHFNGTDYYRKNYLHDCYNTAQQFKKDVQLIPNGTKKPIERDLRATYTVLSPNYFKAKQQEISSKVEKDDSKPDTTVQPVKPPLPIKQMVFLAICLIGWFIYSKTDEASTSTAQDSQTQASQVQSTKKESSTGNKNSQTETAQARYFITCAVKRSDGIISYCFELDGKPFDPHSLGAAIQQFKPCLAYLHFPDEPKQKVTCNPVREETYTAAYDNTDSLEHLEESVIL